MQTDSLVEQLFAIAQDHQASRQDRVARMVPLLLAVEAEKFRPDTRSWENADCNWQSFKLHSLIDRKQELHFFGNFIQLIFKQYGALASSFSWSQRQEYDDHWYPFELLELQLNDSHLLYKSGFDSRTDGFINGYCELWYPPEDFIYRQKAATLGLVWEGPIDDDFWEKVIELELYDVHFINYQDEAVIAAYQKKYEPPASVFLVFMQSLYEAYGANYFIDLFGWSSSVYIDQKGIALELVQRTPSHPLEPEAPEYQEKPSSGKPWWKFW
ncbi:MAG: hypothetical protein IT260_08475 [Saprospiraceae bacterium]|nr:hypothetical protein [Saprospiraceae bacterium]